MDDQRDYAEEAYNAAFCAECDGPCRCADAVADDEAADRADDSGDGDG